MIDLPADVAVLGAGFGGSLTALLLHRVGLKPVLIDRGSHPRFAIGESSTPVADYVLRDLTRSYNLPRLAPLAKYGTWQASYPEIKCGLKRGFSYFHHQPEVPFRPQADHDNELLVAASQNDEQSDTHWLRSDVDSFFAAEVQREDVPFLDRTEVRLAAEGANWLLTGNRLGKPVRLRVRFLIDATGEAGIVPKALGIRNDAQGLATHSRAIYSHFASLQPWAECLHELGGSLDEHPFPCDAAALHHLLEEGWMWQLRFNHGVTSAGFAIDSARYPLSEEIPVESEWLALLQRYPSIAAQFSGSAIVDPPGRILRSGRLQRWAARMVGDNWALLPNTAGFIDPLHSTGIAQTLCGIERLVESLRQGWDQPGLRRELSRYEEILRGEIRLVDRLVSGGYLGRVNHRLFTAFSMLYFAAATTYERRRHARQLTTGAAFLLADDAEFTRLVDDVWEELKRVLAGGVSESQVAGFERCVADAIRPYNHVGLCDTRARNLYRYTAAPATALH